MGSASEDETVAGSVPKSADVGAGRTPDGPVLRSIVDAHGSSAGGRVDLDAGDPSDASPAESGQPSSRYAVQCEIARGGMGAIFKVRDGDLRRTLAMKVLLGEGSTGREPGAPVTGDHLNRFLEEAQVTAQLAHPGVVPVHELGIDSEGRIFFTMDLVRGKTFSDVVALARDSADGWSMARALQVILRVCETMAFAHEKGVVHRDLKPANVMVGRFGETYVMDWGIAKVQGATDLHDVRPRPLDSAVLSRVESRRGDSGAGHDSPIMTMDGAVIGTPAYMAPEQAAGRVDEIGARSDVYAIGAMLYELLTGQPPYTAHDARISPYAILVAVQQGPPRPVHELAAGHSEEIQAICDKAMARRPEDRYSSAVELAEDVQRYLDGRVVLAHKTGAVVEFRKWVARNRAVAATVTIAAIALVAVSGWFVGRLADERNAAQTQRDRAIDAETDAAARADEARNAQKAAERALAAKAVALRRSRALALASASAIAEAEDPMQALLLACQAGRLELTPEVVTRLRGALRVTLERRNFTGHLGAVYAADVSPDGARVVTASEDGTAIVWSLDGRQLAVLRGHTGALRAARFSPDGRTIATGSDDCTGRIWTLRGDVLAVLRDRLEVVDEVTFSDDGARVATVCGSGAAVFDTDGSRVFSINHGTTTRSATFTSDGSLLITVADGGGAAVWDMEGHEVQSVASSSPSMIESAAVAPDDSRVVTVDGRGVIQIWNRDADTRRALEAQGTEATCAAWSRDGERLVTAGPRSVSIWTRDGDLVVTRPSVTGDVGAIAFSHSGDRFLTAAASGRVDLRDRDGVLLAELRGHTAEVAAAMFVPGSELVLTASHDGTARLWSPSGSDAKGGAAATLIGHRAAVTSAVFAPDGDRVLTGSADGTVRLWDLEGKELLVLEGHETMVSSARFAPDGRHIVSASSNLMRKDMPGSARLWDLDGNQVARLDGHGFGILDAEFRGDGERIITAGLDGTARIWDLDGQQLSYLARGRGNPLLSATYTPDGLQVLTSSYHGEINLWDLDGTQKRLFRATWKQAIGRISFAPDDHHFAAASTDSSAWIFSLTGRDVVRLRGHEGWVISAVFSPDGTRLLTASQDGTARIWDRQGRQLDLIDGHRGPVLHATFAPSGDRVVTAGADRTARIWIVGGERLLSVAASRVTRDLTMEEREQYAALLGDENRRLLGARVHVDALVEELKLREDVIARIRDDETLDDEFRTAALRVAVTLPPDSAEWLWALYWPIARDPARSPEEYREAVRLARGAKRMEPWRSRWRGCLGVALYRAGAFEEARTELEAAADIVRTRDGGSERTGVPSYSALLAMTCHRLGRAEDAARHLTEMRRLAREQEATLADSERRFLAEAEELCGEP